MKLIQTKNYKELSKIAADLVIKQISKEPNSVICFATGRTPQGLYRILVRKYKKGLVDFSKIKSFNLDEYYPIKKSDKNSYYYYMHKYFFNKINIHEKNVYMLDGESIDFKKECAVYEKNLKNEGIDLQILGVGVNGHIGFNEPASKRNSKTRLVSLSELTFKRNSGVRTKIPKSALTMGISNIMKSKKLILLAFGKDKAQAINKLVNGRASSNWPVTYLRAHKNLVVIVDKKAGPLVKF